MDKTYNSSSIEALCKKIWEDCGLFKASQHITDREIFTIMMPPPNVTGSLHVGHALTFSIQDALVRWNRMHAHNVLWQPGTDHAGIATQTRVIQHLQDQNINTQALTRDELVEHIWKWKDQYSHTIIDQLKALGSSAQWDRLRFTMDPGFSDAVIHAFNTLYDQGLIYRAQALVNWDTKLQTAISDLEIIQKDHTGTLYYLNYQTDHGPVPVATTRPETLFGDTALAVHPQDERYQHLIGQQATIPLIHKKIPIIGDIHAQPDKGSGVVKITPAHDFNDYAVGKRHNLTQINILNKDGTLNNSTPDYVQGKTIQQARKIVLTHLHDSKTVVKEEKHKHSVPYGDRSNTVIEPMLMDQWFVDAKPMADKALAEFRANNIQFFPERWGKTFEQWLENIQPWCVSRQISWGHRIPVWWYGDQFFVARTEEEAKEKAAKALNKPVELTQDPDVLDTWFSSGLWPFATLGWPQTTPELEQHFPSSLLITGFDIIFFWVARMAMMSLQLTGKIPFKHVLIHGLIRDEKGQKMSKSKGNVINPLAILDEYGADSLRLALLAAASPGQDVRLTTQHITSMRNFCTKLWNTARYAQMNNITLHTQATAHHPLNQWMIQEIQDLCETTTKHINNYQIYEAVNTLYQAFWHEFCNWFLESSKPLLKNSDTHTETTTVFGYALNKFLHLLHPFIPHVTEAIWQTFTKDQQPLALQQNTPALAGTGQDLTSFKNVVTAARSYIKKFQPNPVHIAVHSSTEHANTWLPLLQELLPDCVWDTWDNKPHTIQCAQGAFTLYVYAPDMNITQEIEDLKAAIARLQSKATETQDRIQKQSQAPKEAVEAWNRTLQNYQQQIDAANISLKQFEAVKK